MILFFSSHVELSLFLIIVLGSLIGKVNIVGFSLGSSGVLFVALIAGYIGITLPSALKSIGLILFIYGVGLEAGPQFLNLFKKNGIAFNFLAVIIVSTAAIIVLIGKELMGLPTELAVGIFSGSLTSTPGLVAGEEATQSNLTSIGYGVSYPFGVLVVILFLKIFQLWFGNECLEEESTHKNTLGSIKNENTEKYSIYTITGGLLLGILFGTIPINSIKMGVSGGVLVSSLIFSVKGFFVPQQIVTFMREFGLFLFLSGVGTSSGSKILPIVSEYGVSLIVFAILVTVLPMLLSTIIGVIFFRLPFVKMVGIIAGGMTSTPGLSVVSQHKQASTSIAVYATVYPASLFLMIIWSKVLAMF